MMIQRIDALSTSTNVSKFKQQYQTTPSFDGLSAKKSAQTMKALAAAAVLGMTAVNMSACKQPIDPTPIEKTQVDQETPVEETPIEEGTDIKPVIPKTSSLAELQYTNNFKMLKAMGFNIGLTNITPEELQQENFKGRETGNLCGWGLRLGSSTMYNLLEAIYKVDPHVLDDDYNFLPDESKPYVFEKLDSNNNPIWSMSVINHGNDAVLTKGNITPAEEIYVSCNVMRADGSSAKVDRVKINPEHVTLYMINIVDNDSYKDLEKVKNTSFYNFVNNKYDKEVWNSEKGSYQTIKNIPAEPYNVELVEVRDNKNIKNGDILELELTDKDNNKYSFKRNSNGTYSFNYEEGEYVLQNSSYNRPSFDNTKWADANKSKDAKYFTINEDGTTNIREYTYSAGHYNSDYNEVETTSRNAVIAYVPNNN